MKIYKKLLSLVIALLVMLGMVACVQNTEVKSFHVSIYTDPDTNVQYIVYRTGYGTGMSPRYTADGKIMLKEN